MILGDPLFCPLPPHHANNRMWVECCDTTQRPLRFLYHHIPAVEEPRSLQSRLRLQRKYTHVIKCIVQKHNVWALFYCTRWEREKKSGYLSLHHDRISSRGAAVQVFLSFIHSFKTCHLYQSVAECTCIINTYSTFLVLIALLLFDLSVTF